MTDIVADRKGSLTGEGSISKGSVKKLFEGAWERGGANNNNRPKLGSSTSSSRASAASQDTTSDKSIRKSASTKRNKRECVIHYHKGSIVQVTLQTGPANV